MNFKLSYLVSLISASVIFSNVAKAASYPTDDAEFFQRLSGKLVEISEFENLGGTGEYPIASTSVRSSYVYEVPPSGPDRSTAPRKAGVVYDSVSWFNNSYLAIVEKYCERNSIKWTQSAGGKAQAYCFLK